jgi:toxin YoeB
VKVLLTPCAAEDLAYWQSGDPPRAQRIAWILSRLRRDEPVSPHQISALTLPYPKLMSVKIDAEHRLVYERLGDRIIVHQCRYHY